MEQSDIREWHYSTKRMSSSFYRFFLFQQIMDNYSKQNNRQPEVILEVCLSENKNRLRFLTSNDLCRMYNTSNALPLT